MRPVGPSRRFSARGRLFHVSTPTRAVNGRTAVSARHPSQYPEAHGPSVPRARLDASWWRWAACLPSQAERPASQPAGPGSPAERVSACPGRPPDPQRRGPSPHAQPNILHRATTSTRVPIPTQARASATGGCGTGQHVGLGAERRSGGDQRLHSPTAWLPPGHEPGTGGVAQLPSSKKVWPLGPEDFWIDDATPWSRRSIGVTARRQARMRARAHTARTERSRHARHDHGGHGSVTARTPRSRRARFGHGAHASVTARTHRSRRARLDRCARGAARQALWAQRARRPRRRGYYSARSGAGGEAAAAGQLRAAQAWRVESPVAMAISIAQAGDSRAGGTSTARG